MLFSYVLGVIVDHFGHTHHAPLGLLFINFLVLGVIACFVGKFESSSCPPGGESPLSVPGA